MPKKGLNLNAKSVVVRSTLRCNANYLNVSKRNRKKFQFAKCVGRAVIQQ